MLSFMQQIYTQAHCSRKHMLVKPANHTLFIDIVLDETNDLFLITLKSNSLKLLQAIDE